MTFFLRFTVFTLLFALTNISYAEKICLKSKVAGNQVKHKTITVASSAACPNGTIQIIDTVTLSGAPGLQGAQGLQGLQGAQGAQGPTGGYVPTLPSGQLIKGVFGSVTSHVEAGQYIDGYQTFPLALPSDLIATHYINDGDPAIDECPGTTANPDALAGHLCLYEQAGENIGTRNIFNPATGTASMAGMRYGFLVDATATAYSTGFTGFEGSYAVRAQ
jgi:hypothetical protein